MTAEKDTLYKKLTGLVDSALPAQVSGVLRSAVRRHRERLGQLERQRRTDYWASHKPGDPAISISIQPDVDLLLSFDSDLCRLLYMGYYEFKERHFLNAFLRPGDLFVDVGANIGLYSMIAARISGESGRVIAFEPCARTAGRLRKNIEANHLKNVSCQQMALSDAKGEMQMQVSLDGFDAWNSLAADSNAVVESGASETVVTDTWDSVEEALCQSEKPAMIKVDIEGWESRFLRGAGRSMIGPRAPEVLQLEFNDEAAKAAGSCGKEVYQSLTSYGYQLFTYQPDVRALVAEPIQDHYSYVNLLATKDPVFVNQRLKTGKVPEWMR